MKARVAILTHNRPEILELCLLKLGLTDEHRKHMVVTVYGNDEQETGRVVAERCGVGYVNLYAVDDSGVEDRIILAQRSLGRARHDIVGAFCLDSDFGGDECYLVMLDDDILVTADTILLAIADFESLGATLKPACIALHPFKKRLGKSSIKIGKTLFNSFDFSGECAMIWRRDILKQIGNHFGPGKGGHGDIQFQEASKVGMLLTSFHPSYEMQHVGFDEFCPSQVFGHLERGPGWTRQPLKDYTIGRILCEDDLIVWRSQGLEALKAMLQEGTKMKTKGVEPVVDAFPKAHGRVDIQKVRVADGEVVAERHIQNLVVDKAKEIMSHLLAGDDPDNYKVSKMTFGTNPDTPTVDDLVVKTPITPVKPIDSVDYPNASSVRFIVTLQQDEANGFPIAEAGLQANNGIVARVAFGPLSKDADFIFIFRWTIYW